MPTNKATMLKLKKQISEAQFNAKMKDASDHQYRKPRLYWLVNRTSNRRSDRPVTFEEANSYIRGVERHYELVPCV